MSAPNDPLVGTTRAKVASVFDRHACIAATSVVNGNCCWYRVPLTLTYACQPPRFRRMPTSFLRGTAHLLCRPLDRVLALPRLRDVVRGLHPQQRIHRH